MDGKDDALAQVSAAEWQLLECLWREGPLYMADLVARLYERTNWSRTTVLTLASRLERKGYIGTERSQRAYLYVPVVSRKLALRERVASFVDETFDGDYYTLAKVLAESGELDEEAIKKLRARARKAPRPQDAKALAENRGQAEDEKASGNRAGKKQKSAGKKPKKKG